MFLLSQFVSFRIALVAFHNCMYTPGYKRLSGVTQSQDKQQQQQQQQQVQFVVANLNINKTSKYKGFQHSCV